MTYHIVIALFNENCQASGESVEPILRVKSESGDPQVAGCVKCFPRVPQALEAGNPRLRRISALTKCVLYFQDGCRIVVIDREEAISAEISNPNCGKIRTPQGNWLGSSLSQIQGWTTVQ